MLSTIFCEAILAKMKSRPQTASRSIINLAQIMHYLALFFAGAFFCNCIPHLVAGLQGMPFPSPFATPRGVGNSSPLVNVLWGAVNLGLALLIVARHPFALGANPECLTVALGALVLGIYMALHFGKVRQQGLSR
jgi:hypothetical protein